MLRITQHMSLQKKKRFLSKKLRDSANGERCTFRIPGVCNENPETTVLCHLPDESGTGVMAGKSDDWIAAFGCSACHDYIDGRKRPVSPLWSLREEMSMARNAMLRTWRRWIELGLVEIK